MTSRSDGWGSTQWRKHNRPVTRRERRDLWRRVAEIRDRQEDKAGAATARRNARLADSPARSFCFGCGDLHAHDDHHDCRACVRRQEAMRGRVA